MFKNILIPIALDHPSDVDRMLEVAHRLQAADGKTTLIGVAESVPEHVAEYMTVHPENTLKDKVKARLMSIVEQYPGIGAKVTSGKPGISIPELAEDMDADLILINSRGPSAEDYFLGSTASRVVRRSPCAVMVLR